MKTKRFSLFDLLLQKITFASESMTATICKQLVWEDFSRGFHGGRIESDEICIFEEDDEKQFVQFAVQEYTSDEEDFFGVCVPKWEIILTLRDIRAEYTYDRQWLIGKDYARANYAQEFCDYALNSIKEHGNISRLPFSEIID